jgi:replicative DNA helicase
MQMNTLSSLPFSEEMEKGLLCSMIRHPAVIDLAGGIRPELFYIPAHRIIFQHVIEVISDTGVCEWNLLKHSFTSLIEISEIGGFDGLNRVYDFVPSYENWKFYLDELYDLHRTRLAILAAMRLLETAQDQQNRQMDFAAEFERYAKQIRASNLSEPERFWHEEVADEIKAVSDRHSNQQRYYKLFGLSRLDQTIGGIFPGDFVVIAAQTSKGKSSLALKVAAHVSLGDQQLKTIVFSYEMNRQKVRKRIISSRASIRLSALRYPEEHFTEEDMKKLQEFYRQTPRGRCIMIEDSYILTIEAVSSRCRQLKVTGGLDVVIVDYLQLMPPSIRDSNRQREVAEMSRKLKALAMQLDVVVVALSQLNEQGQLRESRAIGQDADYILIIQDKDEDKFSTERELIVDKVRDGTGAGQKIKLNFYGDYASWEDQ